MFCKEAIKYLPMPAGGTRLTKIFGGSLRIELVRFVVPFADDSTSLASSDKGLSKGGRFVSMCCSIIDACIFVL